MKKAMFYLCLLAFLASCQQKSEPLNVVVLYTDDQRFNTIHAWGNDEIFTPNMDKLVKMGVSFTRAHVMGGHHGAVCAPSRAMLLTGKPYFNITKDFIDKRVPYSEDFDFTTFPEFFREKGYKTFFTGKWHNHTGKIREGFDEGENIFIGGMHFPKSGGHENPELWDYDPTGEYPHSNKITRDTFSSEIYSNAAVRFINQQNIDNPFCLYVAYTSPHDPRTAPQKYLDIYDTAKISLPENYLPKHPFDNGHLNIRDELLAPFPRTEAIIKEEIKGYYAMVSEVDAQIGRVLDALEEKGLMDNTLIVFAGDNGLAVGQHGLLGKQNVYEHSIRVPLIFAAPNIKGNRKANTLAYIHDIFPTICDITGNKHASSIEGKSLMPAIKNVKTKIRKELFLSHAQQMRAIRTDDDWKYIRYFVEGQVHEQLYNLNNDPNETLNLVDNPTHVDKLKALKNKLIEGILTSNDDFLKPVVNIQHKGFGQPVEVSITKPFEELDVRYTTDGTTPTTESLLYEAPFQIEKTATVKAQIFANDESQQEAVQADVAISKKVKSVKLSVQPPKRYKGQLGFTLVDNQNGSKNHKDGKWLGFQGEDVEIIIELEKMHKIEDFGISYLTHRGTWIFPPSSFDFSVSDDGVFYHLIENININYNENSPSHETGKTTSMVKGIFPKFIRFRIKNTSALPDWHDAAGQKAWMFIDELIF